MISEDTDALVAILSNAITDALPDLERDGWTFAGITSRYLMHTHLPVLRFERRGETLCFIVAPTDPSQPAFKRSVRFDISYFSEDVPDDKQSEIYRRDRAQIERVAAWLRRWDG
jgi:hypothetical protein